MLAAGVADEYRSPLNPMTLSSVSDTPVNGVLVVEASACRVKLDNLVAHLESREVFGLLCVLAGLVGLLARGPEAAGGLLPDVWGAAVGSESCDVCRRLNNNKSVKVCVD